MIKPRSGGLGDLAILERSQKIGHRLAREVEGQGRRLRVLEHERVFRAEDVGRPIEQELQRHFPTRVAMLEEPLDVDGRPADLGCGQLVHDADAAREIEVRDEPTEALTAHDFLGQNGQADLVQHERHLVELAVGRRTGVESQAAAVNEDGVGLARDAVPAVVHPVVELVHVRAGEDERGIAVRILLLDPDRPEDALGDGQGNELLAFQLHIRVEARHAIVLLRFGALKSLQRERWG